jgi:hypothetical protein
LLDAEFYQSAIVQILDALGISEILDFHKDVRMPSPALDATVPLLVAKPPEVSPKPFGHI